MPHAASCLTLDAIVVDDDVVQLRVVLRALEAAVGALGLCLYVLPDHLVFFRRTQLSSN